MKLFDLIGGKVKIHPDAIGIPCFRRVWDADKPDKEHATKVISYIVLMNKWDMYKVWMKTVENLN